VWSLCVLIWGRAVRPRWTLSVMMSSAVAFQTRGVGSVFQWMGYVVMASVRSAALVMIPRGEGVRR
jgi:hypothetical protein